jgi:hypothetical protein
MDRVIRGYDTVRAGEYVRLRVTDQRRRDQRSGSEPHFRTLLHQEKNGAQRHRSGARRGLGIGSGSRRLYRCAQYANRVRAPCSTCTSRSRGTPLEEKDPHGSSLAAIQGRGERILVVDDMQSQRHHRGSHLLQSAELHGPHGRQRRSCRSLPERPHGGPGDTGHDHGSGHGRS